MIRVCSIEDVPPGEGRAVVIDGCRVAVFNTVSGWYALDAVCPHRGGPLEDGIVAERSVTCPLHERRFDLVTGGSYSDCPAVTPHRVDVRGEGVFVELGTGAVCAA